VLTHVFIQMNMLWNSDIEDVCVVFSSWHITGPLTMLLSWYVPSSVHSNADWELIKMFSLAVAAIAIFYSFLLHYISRNDRSIAISIVSEMSPANRRESIAPGRRESLIPPIPQGYSSIETGAARIGM